MIKVNTLRAKSLLLFLITIFVYHFIFTSYHCPILTQKNTKVTVEKLRSSLISTAERAEFRDIPAYKYLNNSLTKDLYDAGFDIPNEYFCPESGASMKLLIIIPSARRNGLRRMDIRRTYGHNYALRKDVAKLFFFGRPENPAPDDVASNIASESYAYGDVVVGRFVDTFHNLTLKTTSALEWVATYCSKVKFILKADDDIFLNIPRILDLLESWSDQTRSVLGELITVGPQRDTRDHHYVSTQEYNQSAYPAYAFGQAAYFITGDIVKEMFTQGLSTPYLSIEDAFYTGFVAQSIGATKIFYEHSYKWHNYTYWHGQDDKYKCNFEENVSLWAPDSKHKSILWDMTLSDGQPCT